MRKLRRFLLISNFILLSSCGYHWELKEQPTVSVPFIPGDEEGTFTNEVIHALASSGIARVVSKGGEYSLKIEIVNIANETVDFRIDPQKIKGEVRQTLLATEGRKTVRIQAGLYRGEELVHGPYKLSASAEYDYVDGDSFEDLTFVNPKGETIVVLPFSLGQLESMEAAQEAASRPLNARLAQKIVDVISAEW